MVFPRLAAVNMREGDDVRLDVLVTLGRHTVRQERRS
jgi:hypothetical protein